MDSKSETRRLLLIIWGLSIATRLAFGLFVIGFDAPPIMDAENYDQIAANLISKGSYIQYNSLFENGVWYSYRAPLLPFVLAGVYYLFGHSLVASRLLMILIGSIIPLVVFAFTRRIFGKTPAVIAAIISACYPFFILYSNLLLTEAPAVLLTSLLILFLVRFSDEGRLRDVCVAGVMAGLGCLSRSSLLTFVPVAGLWVLVIKRGGYLRSLKAALLFLVVALAVIAPWTYRNYLIHGQIVPISTLGGLQLWKGNNQWTTGKLDYDDRVLPEIRDRDMLPRIKPGPGTTMEAEIDRFFRREAWDFIKSHPKRFLVLGLKKIFHFWRPEGFGIPSLAEQTPKPVRLAVGLLSYVPLFLLFVVGLIRSLKDLSLFRNPGLLLLALFMVGYTFFHAVFPSLVRYRQPLEPAIIAIGSWALTRLHAQPVVGFDEEGIAGHCAE
jgi:4-amino-4-deoxy-L-arabinose transferase-like glycosyltransferase